MPASEPVQSVLRSLDILDLVARSEDGLTLQQLARRLDLKPPTAHNLARSLLARGFLEKAARPTRYRLGGAIQELAALQGGRSLRRRAADVLRPLAVQLAPATVTMAEPVGGEVATVLRISPQRPGVLEQPRANVLPAYTSVSVLVMMAFWPAEAADAYRRRYPFEIYGLAVWQSPAALAGFLAGVRRLGYAAQPGGRFGPQRVAVPVFSDTNELVGALGAALHPEDAAGATASSEEMAARLAEAARDIAAAQQPTGEKEQSWH
jgi:DNA-binding IclR family transcriptional regulator